MSYWTSLVLVRAAPPPIVTAAAIGAFVRDLAATTALVEGAKFLCQIKYGPNVDADERNTDVIEWNDSGIIGTVGEYQWDRWESAPSLAALASTLSADTGMVYRAYLILGELHPDISVALTREPSDENEVGLSLDTLSFNVGPMLVSGLGSEAQAFAGWMGLTFSGPGYFYPWEYRKVRERARSVELVGRLAEACRRAWPVAPMAPSAGAVAARQQLAELWLYDDFARESDWLWFVSESG